MKKIIPVFRLLQFLGIFLSVIFTALILKVFVLDAVYLPSRSMEETLFAGDYVLVNKLIYSNYRPYPRKIKHASIPYFQLPGLGNIKRGDVIVFEFPSYGNSNISQNPMYFVKRCVGLSGDTIAIRNGIVYINGKRLKIPLDSRIETVDNIPATIIPQKGSIININEENYSHWIRLIEEEGHTVSTSLTSEITIDGILTTKYTIERNYLFVLGDNMEHSYDSRYWGFLPEDNVIGKAMMVYWSLSPEKSNHSFSSFFTSIRWDRIGKFVN